MNTKSPECWASDPQARGLRIEILPTKYLLLLFDQFVFAELETSGKEQQLRLVFATHEVVVRGHALRRIEAAMQRMDLSLVAVISDHHRSMVPDGQPVILEIVVVENKREELRS